MLSIAMSKWRVEWAAASSSTPATVLIYTPAEDKTNTAYKPAILQQRFNLILGTVVLQKKACSTLHDIVTLLGNGCHGNQVVIDGRQQQQHVRWGLESQLRLSGAMC